MNAEVGNSPRRHEGFFKALQFPSVPPCLFGGFNQSHHRGTETRRVFMPHSSFVVWTTHTLPLTIYISLPLFESFVPSW